MLPSHFVLSQTLADGPPPESASRFLQAQRRTFNTFDRVHEKLWQGPFFFMQLADTQYGMFTNNQGFPREISLVQQTVTHINRLRPRFVIVCGDLTNATPQQERYDATRGSTPLLAKRARMVETSGQRRDI